jgi:hypothetical protein
MQPTPQADEPHEIAKILMAAYGLRRDVIDGLVFARLATW